MRKRALLAILALLAIGAAVQAEELTDDPHAKSVKVRRPLMSIEQGYQRMAKREADLVNSELQLKILLSEVSERLSEMQKLRETLHLQLDGMKKEEGQRIQDLSKIYEKMDPAKVALMIKEFDRQMAVELLRNIKSKAAGKIFNNLDVKTAISLSRSFASIPTEERSGY
jgi:flagellar motility protein MotE (MotC chaperone)